MKKEAKIKVPKLKITFDDEIKQNEQTISSSVLRNNITIRPLSSAKNAHQLKNFNFEPENIEKLRKDKKKQEIKKLELEKSQLMKSLEILKHGALSALMEKQEKIQELINTPRNTPEQQLYFYQKELQKSRMTRRQLQQQKQQLQDQFDFQRKKYLRKIQQKQQDIEELTFEIIQTRRQVDQLSHNDEVKSKKIKNLSQQVEVLSQQLQISIATTNQLERQKSERTEMDVTVVKYNMAASHSSSNNKHYLSVSGSIENILDLQENTTFSEKITTMDKKHKEEIEDLTDFYEKRITGLRQIYQRQLMLPTESNESQIRSRSRSGNSQQLVRDRSISQLKVDNKKDMYAIDEKVEQELEKSRYDASRNLKYELEMNRLSQCPSRKYGASIINDDASSQFTTKYFQYPQRFLKKNKSYDSFRKVEDEEKEEKQTQKLSFWNKPIVFTLGLISGVSVATVVSKLFSKN